MSHGLLIKWFCSKAEYETQRMHLTGEVTALSSVLMDGQVFDNEISFCKVYTTQAKQELERAFLRHRVSYFVEWQDKGFWQRIFAPKGNRISCTIRINKADYAIARDLVRGIKDIKVRSPRGIQERDTVKDLAKKKAAREDDSKRARPAKPVIRKTSSRQAPARQESASSRQRQEDITRSASSSGRKSSGQRGASGKNASQRRSGQGASGRTRSGSSSRSRSGQR